ncbi:GDSL-type esterase/lipase family protein [Mucilaginibacter corticis]|nr:GDSL-type esterase/lipase family protein [Mucilaginibacter corticis]
MKLLIIIKTALLRVKKLLFSNHLFRFEKVNNTQGMFWYEHEIKRLEHRRAETTDEPETLFYGSSSIRLWTDLENDFKELRPVNLGFGGSTLAACAWFFERVMTGYQPKRLVLYAGDNDLGDGRHPEEIFIFFRDIAARVQKRFGPIPCYFISLKPSLSRWHLIEQFKFTNLIIATEINENWPNWQTIDIFSSMLGDDGRPRIDYFMDDGLHLSPKGYEVWKSVIQRQLNMHT